MVDHGNLFAALPHAAAGEVFDLLTERPGVRVERIVSLGHATPAGQWYDQQHDEWVALLRGSASLSIEGEPGPRQLHPGDWLLLPARCRHRVERTDADTLWLALHLPAGRER